MIFDLFNRMRSSRIVKISGAEPARVLNACAEQGIDILSGSTADGFTVTVRVAAEQAEAAAQIARRSQCTAEVSPAFGAARAARLLRRRLVPALCLLLFASALLISKAFVWEIDVVGNETVPTGRILNTLRQCGVGIGSFWPDFTSDNIRSEVLMRLPELSWMTVNMHGSRAEIIVRERVKKPEMLNDKTPTDVFAKKDGFIMEILALNGASQVKRGEIVSAGQLLISSAMPDRRGEIRTVHASGEVKARTYYELTAVYPQKEKGKCYNGEKKSRWSLVAGGKRINFYRNSSISDEECDTIYSVYKLGIKGLFSFPVSLVRQQSIFYETEERESDGRLVRDMLEGMLHERLVREIGSSGEIIYENCSGSSGDGVLSVCLRSECEENIAVSRTADAD